MALAGSDEITLAELQLAARNHGMPLEALRYPLTPVGLHYLLIHYDIPAIDPASWRLRVGGRVRHELSLSLDDLRSRPTVVLPVTMECAGNGRAKLAPRPLSQPWLDEAVGNAEWGGTPLRPLLEEAGLLDDAVEVLFTGLDRGLEGDIDQHYERSLAVVDALRDEVMLAWEMNGAPLPPQHGFPLRLVVPGWYGMTSVKWLGAVTVLERPFDGYQQRQGYRFRQAEGEDGEPVTRIAIRALMVPPGVPDFMTRRRLVDGGRCVLEGRAWSGRSRVTAVEVSADGGSTWAAAELAGPPGPFAWSAWRFDWDPPGPGEYTLCCRASDDAGGRQPLEPPWNLGGYANNAVQRVPVTVRD
jgi:DMSO/TMAO reductase YedYZ molybdopterin-dependent catalytic subunit